MEINAKLVKDLREQTGAGMMDCKKALTATNGNIEDAINWLREKGISKSAKREMKIAAEGIAKILVDKNKAIILEVNSETDFVSKNKEFIEMVDLIAQGLLNSSAQTITEAQDVLFAGMTIKELLINKTAKIGEKLSLRRFTILTKKDEEVFGSYTHLNGKIAALTVVKGNDENIAKDIAMQTAAMKPLYILPSEVPADVLDNEKQILMEQAINEGKPKDIAAKMVQGRLKKFYQEVCLSEQTFIKDNNLKVCEYLANNNSDLRQMIRYEVGEGLTKKSENFLDEVIDQVNKN